MKTITVGGINAPSSTIAFLAAIYLSGCGGGGPSTPTDNTTAYAKQAITNIAAAVPEAKPAFTGAFTAINGVSNGYIAAPSKEAIAKGLANTIVAEPVKWATFYQLMLSEGGLKITVYGETLPVSASGLAQHAPDTIYTAKLTTNGIIIT